MSLVSPFLAVVGDDFCCFRRVFAFVVSCSWCSFLGLFDDYIAIPNEYLRPWLTWSNHNHDATHTFPSSAQKKKEHITFNSGMRTWGFTPFSIYFSLQARYANLSNAPKKNKHAKPKTWNADYMCCCRRTTSQLTTRHNRRCIKPGDLDTFIAIVYCERTRRIPWNGRAEDLNH